MTGFGRGEASQNDVAATVEARSVNQRFLKVSVRMPSWVASLEPLVRETVGKSVRRGQVDVVVELAGAGARPRVSIDVDAVANYIEEWRRVQHELNIHGDLTVEVLAASADLVTTSAPAQPPEEVWPVIEDALGGALSALAVVRSAEGDATARDILDRVEAIDAGVAVIEERAPAAVTEHVERLSSRVKDVLEAAGSAGGLSEEDVAREVALLAQKSDVAEEITRLRSHIEQTRELFSDGGSEVGRRLEFLVQEMVREINTIGSKSADVEISRRVVEVKAEIERIREQARNIE